MAILQESLLRLPLYLHVMVGKGNTSWSIGQGAQRTLTCYGCLVLSPDHQKIRSVLASLYRPHSNCHTKVLFERTPQDMYPGPAALCDRQSISAIIRSDVTCTFMPEVILLILLRPNLCEFVVQETEYSLIAPTYSSQRHMQC